MNDEQKAREAIESMAEELNGGKPLQRYTVLDMVRFARLCKDDPDENPYNILRNFVPLFERRTAVKMMDNLRSFLDEKHEPPC